MNTGEMGISAAYILADWEKGKKKAVFYCGSHFLINFSPFKDCKPKLTVSLFCSH